MRTIILVAVLGLSGSAFANQKVLDLAPYMADRFEKYCGIRNNYDLAEGTEKTVKDVNKVLRPYVAKVVEEDADKVAYVTTFIFKNVQYKGIPVKKIEYGYGYLAKQYNQRLILDLSTATAKQKFKQIKFHTEKPNEFVDLYVTKKGQLVEVHCTWPDPKHSFLE